MQETYMNGSLQGETLEVLPLSGKCKYMYLGMLLFVIPVIAISIYNMGMREGRRLTLTFRNGTMLQSSPTGFTLFGRELL